MRRCPRRLTALPVALLLLGLACSGGDGGGTGPPATTPLAIQVEEGDQQAAAPGDTLFHPLGVRVIGRDSAPLAGATVHWAVTVGEATLTPADAPTDASGIARTRVRMRAAIGAVHVTATVQGLEPATFILEAFDPCTRWYLLLPDFRSSGRLQPLDCLLRDGGRWDLYYIQLDEQRAVALHSASDSVSTALWLFGWSDGLPRAREVDSSATHESVVKAILGAGRWTVGVTSYPQGLVGPYVLVERLVPSSAEGCERVWLGLPVSTAQTLSPTDCSDGSYLSDRFAIGLAEGERVTIRGTSTAFGTTLRLLRGWSRTEVARSQGAPGQPSELAFTTDSAGAYALIVSSAAAGQTGAYTLTAADQAATLARVTEIRPTERSALPLTFYGKGRRFP